MDMAFSARLLNELRSRTRLSDLISQCGIKLLRRVREFVGLCPSHRERTPSFTVADDKHLFHCFGCGAHGDVFAFLMRIDNIDFRTAVAKIAGGLGAENDGGPRVGAVSNKNQLGDREARNREFAWRLWTAAGDPRGTPVEKYLHHRGLELPPGPVLRWAPRCWNRETSRELPAMLARVDDHDGKFVAVHRTWLLPDGSGKADLLEPKWSLGPVGGGAVRLAPAGPVLAVAEGIETALTAIVTTGLPAWSALSAGGIKRLILPAETIDVVIIADHDRSGVGESQARQAAEQWLTGGRRVRIALPPEPGADLNDVLLGACNAAAR
jgi:CHC2 zinc finger/Toprim domain